MSESVQPDGLAAAIIATLENYSEEVTAGIKQDVRDVAQKCRENIERDSPKKSGDYSRHWKVKNSETAQQASALIYNTEGRLTHLLEDGHGIRNGGRTRAFPHIKTNEAAANAELEAKIEKRLADGQ